MSSGRSHRRLSDFTRSEEDTATVVYKATSISPTKKPNRHASRGSGSKHNPEYVMLNPKGDVGYPMDLTIQPLRSAVKAGGLLSREEVFWLRELKDPKATKSAWATWDTATAGERIGAAKWIRSWDDERLVEHARETVGAVAGMMSECFVDDEWMQRWAAEVVLDVFGDAEDLASTVEMFHRPKFGDRRVDFEQFDKLVAFADLWAEGGRAEELLDLFEPTAVCEDGTVIENVHKVLTRWIVASALAELLYTRAQNSAAVVAQDAGLAPSTEDRSARDDVLAKAQSMRRGLEDDDNDDDDDNEWDEEVDVPDVPVNTKEAAPVKKLPPKQLQPRAKTEVGDYYADKEAERIRHDKGYDVMDKAMAKLDSSVDRRSKARELLVEYVAAMQTKGLVFELSFDKPALGFSVVLSRYGDKGRYFVSVESTSDSRLLPGDEIAAINGAFVVDPTPDSIDLVKRTIVEAPRPLVIKFVRGERQDDDRKAAAPSPAVLQQAPNPRLVSARDIAGTLKLVVRIDGEVRKVKEYYTGTQRNPKEKSKKLGTYRDKQILANGGSIIGFARGEGPLVDLVATDGAHVAGYLDLGTGRILDATQSTRFQLQPNGTVKRADGLDCGTLDNFHFSQLIPLGLVVTFLMPNLFALPKEQAKTGFIRAIRKTSSRITGIHGLFSS